jgi:pantothenate kinase
MEGIYKGIAFSMKLDPTLIYTFDSLKGECVEDKDFQFPFLVTNIGSGVSILRFKDQDG